ncbi:MULTISPECIES: ATP-binding cassette domain-containing protein [Gammaproteobacteria]|uniref:ABC transporter ATP-binding protein n=1 Tax=Gammaproteobacteria TaxID=1236 RepID=UPI000DD0BFD3|nr:MULTISPECIES: ATP-binding cassette domain-containing protein [Gammaproteobacteria]RTE86252.1 ATP-binding cassette domain-containing protein [Aliidiomarina sp. B3213]TCZ91603.1 ATP-binding cassette domain-containing protein [Lysobacter sp. N42]
MIEVNDLKKSYQDVQALNGLTFSASDNEITGLLGPNGAGKTTCLRSLYGLIHPDQGEALIDGVAAQKEPLTVRKQIGIFPDKFGLYERLTPREHIAYIAELHGLKGEQQQRNVESVIKSLGMEDIADRKTQGFSQGQRMKVALAQAIVHQPKNLILDEPSRGLDVMSTRILRELMFQLKEEGRCILFSSHVMQEVAALCDRVVIMVKGQVVANDSPQALCEQTGESSFEEAFVKLIGTDEGIV